MTLVCQTKMIKTKLFLIPQLMPSNWMFSMLFFNIFFKGKFKKKIIWKW